MKTVDFFQLFGILLAAFGTFISTIDRRLIARFRKENALNADSAIIIPDLKNPGKWRLNRLIRHGVIRQSVSGGVYLDLEAHWQLKRKRLAVVFVIILLGVIAVSLLII